MKHRHAIVTWVLGFGVLSFSGAAFAYAGEHRLVKRDASVEFHHVVGRAVFSCDRWLPASREKFGNLEVRTLAGRTVYGNRFPGFFGRFPSSGKGQCGIADGTHLQFLEASVSPDVGTEEEAIEDLENLAAEFEECLRHYEELCERGFRMIELVEPKVEKMTSDHYIDEVRAKPTVDPSYFDGLR